MQTQIQETTIAHQPLTRPEKSAGWRIGSLLLITFASMGAICLITPAPYWRCLCSGVLWCTACVLGTLDFLDGGARQ